MTTPNVQSVQRTPRNAYFKQRSVEVKFEDDFVRHMLGDDQKQNLNRNQHENLTKFRMNTQCFTKNHNAEARFDSNYMPKRQASSIPKTAQNNNGLKVEACQSFDPPVSPIYDQMYNQARKLSQKEQTFASYARVTEPGRLWQTDQIRQEGKSKLRKKLQIYENQIEEIQRLFDQKQIGLVAYERRMIKAKRKLLEKQIELKADQERNKFWRDKHIAMLHQQEEQLLKKFKTGQRKDEYSEDLENFDGTRNFNSRQEQYQLATYQQPREGQRKNLFTPPQKNELAPQGSFQQNMAPFQSLQNMRSVKHQTEKRLMQMPMQRPPHSNLLLTWMQGKEKMHVKKATGKSNKRTNEFAGDKELMMMSSQSIGAGIGGQTRNGGVVEGAAKFLDPQLMISGSVPITGITMASARSLPESYQDHYQSLGKLKAVTHTFSHSNLKRPTAMSHRPTSSQDFMTMQPQNLQINEGHIINQQQQLQREINKRNSKNQMRVKTQASNVEKNLKLSRQQSQSQLFDSLKQKKSIDVLEFRENNSPQIKTQSLLQSRASRSQMDLDKQGFDQSRSKKLNIKEEDRNLFQQGEIFGREKRIQQIINTDTAASKDCNAFLTKFLTLHHVLKEKTLSNENQPLNQEASKTKSQRHGISDPHTKKHHNQPWHNHRRGIKSANGQLSGMSSVFSHSAHPMSAHGAMHSGAKHRLPASRSRPQSQSIRHKNPSSRRTGTFFLTTKDDCSASSSGTNSSTSDMNHDLYVQLQLAKEIDDDLAISIKRRNLLNYLNSLPSSTAYPKYSSILLTETSNEIDFFLSECDHLLKPHAEKVKEKNQQMAQRNEAAEELKKAKKQKEAERLMSQNNNNLALLKRKKQKELQLKQVKDLPDYNEIQKDIERVRTERLSQYELDEIRDKYRLKGKYQTLVQKKLTQDELNEILTNYKQEGKYKIVRTDKLTQEKLNKIVKKRKLEGQYLVRSLKEQNGDERYQRFIKQVKPKAEAVLAREIIRENNSKLDAVKILQGQKEDQESKGLTSQQLLIKAHQDGTIDQMLLQHGPRKDLYVVRDIKIEQAQRRKNEIEKEKFVEYFRKVEKYRIKHDYRQQKLDEIQAQINHGAYQKKLVKAWVQISTILMIFKQFKVNYLQNLEEFRKQQSLKRIKHILRRLNINLKENLTHNRQLRIRYSCMMLQNFSGNNASKRAKELVAKFIENSLWRLQFLKIIQRRAQARSHVKAELLNLMKIRAEQVQLVQKEFDNALEGWGKYAMQIHLLKTSKVNKSNKNQKQKIANARKLPFVPIELFESFKKKIYCGGTSPFTGSVSAAAVNDFPSMSKRQSPNIMPISRTSGDLTSNIFGYNAGNQLHGDFQTFLSPKPPTQAQKLISIEDNLTGDTNKVSKKSSFFLQNFGGEDQNQVQGQQPQWNYSNTQQMSVEKEQRHKILGELAQLLSLESDIKMFSWLAASLRQREMDDIVLKQDDPKVETSLKYIVDLKVGEERERQKKDWEEAIESLIPERMKKLISIFEKYAQKSEVLYGQKLNEFLRSAKKTSLKKEEKKKHASQSKEIMASKELKYQIIGTLWRDPQDGSRQLGQALQANLGKHEQGKKLQTESHLAKLPTTLQECGQLFRQKKEQSLREHSEFLKRHVKQQQKVRFSYLNDDIDLETFQHQLNIVNWFDQNKHVGLTREPYDYELAYVGVKIWFNVVNKEREKATNVKESNQDE